MANELDQILFSYKQPDFNKKLTILRSALSEGATFNLLGNEGQTVAKIIDEVRGNGDEAVRKYTKEYDGVDLPAEKFRVPKQQLEEAHKKVDKGLLKSIRQAIKNVRKYQTEIFIGNKKHLGIKYTPIKRVGICVPGASAPLASTVIMTAVPAQIASVKEIVVVSPPRYNESIHPVTLAVCFELGIEKVYRIGGVQAVAALAGGTKEIVKVDKIVGPGNKWVQTAKRMLFGQVGIDSVAGPSEVLIIANDEANPAWAAADMLSQAEHDPGSAAVFTASQQLAEKILEELKKQLERLKRKEAIIKCLQKFSRIAVFENIDDAIGAANDFAAEHLQIQCGERSREIVDKIENAGAIFIGDFTPVAVGDYWAGASHTLPTGGGARFFSALSSNDFVKSTSIIEYDKSELAESSEDIIRLAEAEGLDAHAESIKIRTDKCR